MIHPVIDSTDILSVEDAASVRSLAASAAEADAVAPLSEQTLLRLQDSDAAGEAARVVHLLAREDGLLLGYAQVDDGGTGELFVAPAQRRRGIGRRLLGAAAEASPVDRGLHVWAHGDRPEAAALAASMGYARSRVLLRLRRSLRDPLPEQTWPPGITVRAFVPGQDEAAWLAVNGAAFATHPEQGRWTLHDVLQREQSDWFDPGGFFLAEREGELVGFHWTKVHREENPPMGEVYVVGVRPQDSGHGIGPALTLAGLHHLRGQGLEQVMLYVDEDNVPAVKTYQRLGFTLWSADVLYAGESAEKHL